MNPTLTFLTGAITALTSMCGGGADPAPVRPEAPTIAFCGVNPSDSNAWKQAQVLHDKAGIDNTMGPCLPPASDYRPGAPGQRYLDRNGYAALVEVNAFAGMGTLVYDPGIWSPDPVFRQSVIDFWSQPSFYGGRLLDHIYAWDMGDEFMPGTIDWQELKDRWNLILAEVEPVTGVGPFTNNVGDPAVMDTYLREIPRGYINFNFDMYLGDGGVALAQQYNDQVQSLGCAVNTISHETHGLRLRPTMRSVRDQMRALRAAGCDHFLIFGGAQVVNTPGYDSPSLVTTKGVATSLAAGVLAGSR